ncbi:MAG: VOC family protein [Planctomycetes bacterium]|nr:VOC family protein [Planctomycetota bacterium]
MKIEHLALQVTDPVAMADWYCKNLGFTVKRSADAPVPVRFIADNSGNTILEIYNNPKAPMPDYSSMDPLLLHIAFACENIPEVFQNLKAAGAKEISAPEFLDNGDHLAMLRDPWGLAVQLVNRSNPLG